VEVILMERRLEVKVKKIVGQANPKEGRWSDVLVFTPEEKELEKRRGRLFAVLDLTGGARLDLAGFGHQALEELRDEYYRSEEASLLKSLEEAVHRAQHQLVELVFGPEGAVPDGALDYNFAAAVLWGSVLYLAKLGTAGIYLQRGDVAQELGETKDSKIFSASGMVGDKDVVVLGTSDFQRTFSVEELPGSLDDLERVIADLGQPSGLSALVLRLELSSLPGEEEELKIAPVVKKDSSVKNLLRRFSLPRFSKKVLLAIPALMFLAATAWTINKRQVDFQAAETARLVAQAEQKLADAEQYVDLNNSRARQLLLEAKDDFAAAEEIGGTVLGFSEKIGEIDELLDKANKVIRVEPEKVEEATISFDPLAEVESPPVVDGAVDTGTYFGNLYFLLPAENQILKAAVVAPPASQARALRAGEGEYAEPQYWVITENPPLVDAVSMAIDGFIYVLKSDGSVLKFEKGELVTDFGLKELDRPLANPQAIFTTIESEYLYILDAGNQRIVVTNKEGFYESQYVYECLANLTDLFVDEAVGVIYFLDGAEVYKINL
jgi:hypothetical protein